MALRWRVLNVLRQTKSSNEGLKFKRRTISASLALVISLETDSNIIQIAGKVMNQTGGK